MVEYYSPTKLETIKVLPLAEDSPGEEDDMMLFRAVQREDEGDGVAETEVLLVRDSVAALVGQLQSWLARTAVEARAQ